MILDVKIHFSKNHATMCGGINPRILIVVCRGRQTVTVTLQAQSTWRNSAILIIPHYVEWKERKQEVLCPYRGA